MRVIFFDKVEAQITTKNAPSKMILLISDYIILNEKLNRSFISCSVLQSILFAYIWVDITLPVVV
jgi:hypothetical protein